MDSLLGEASLGPALKMAYFSLVKGVVLSASCFWRGIILVGFHYCGIEAELFSFMFTSSVTVMGVTLSRYVAGFSGQRS